MRKGTLSRPESGITVIEVLLVVAILGMLTSLIIPPFANFRKKKVIDAEAEAVMELIARARMDTLASRDDTEYGIHLDSDSVTYFVGAAYDPMAPTNVTHEVISLVTLGNISLAGGGSDIVFDRLTGTTGEFGTFQLTFASDADVFATITVSSTGTITPS